MSKCTRFIPLTELYRADNVRTDECQQIPAMVASIRASGFKSNHPLVVHQDGVPEGEPPRYLVLCGNRRATALEWFAENEPETLKKLVPSGKVPCIVHKGLTTEEQIEIRIDHSSAEDRIPLDEWSIFMAIKQLCQAFSGDTQTQIAEKLGLIHTSGKNKDKPNRAYVQPRVNLSRLPMFVQDAYESLCRQGKDSTPVRWSQVGGLYKAYNKEFGSFPNGDGPEFQKLWNVVLNPPMVAKDDKDSAKTLSAADARTRAQNANSAIVRDVLMAVTGQGDTDLATVDATAVIAESAIDTLRAIAEYLGSVDYDELIAEATAKAIETATDQVAVVEAAHVSPDTVNA